MKGGTALYDAVFRCRSSTCWPSEKDKNPKYQYSMVAFTDGEVNTAGRNFEQPSSATTPPCPRT